MEWEQLVLRALRVPDVISEPNRINAALWRLLEASPDQLPSSEDRADAAAAVGAVIELGRAGLLDGLLGGWESLAETTVAVGARVGTGYNDIEVLLHHARRVLEAVVAYVEEHPFF